VEYCRIACTLNTHIKLFIRRKVAQYGILHITVYVVIQCVGLVLVDSWNTSCGLFARCRSQEEGSSVSTAVLSAAKYVAGTSEGRTASTSPLPRYCDNVNVKRRYSLLNCRDNLNLLGGRRQTTPWCAGASYSHLDVSGLAIPWCIWAAIPSWCERWSILSEAKPNC